jgi:ribosomal protein L15
MRITVAKASEAALAKITGAGGEIVLPEAPGK